MINPIQPGQPWPNGPKMDPLTNVKSNTSTPMYNLIKSNDKTLNLTLNKTGHIRPWDI